MKIESGPTRRSVSLNRIEGSGVRSLRTFAEAPRIPDVPFRAETKPAVSLKRGKEAGPLRRPQQDPSMQHEARAEMLELVNRQNAERKRVAALIRLYQQQIRELTRRAAAA